MTKRASVVFHPEKKGKKAKFYSRITRLVITGVCINFLIFLLYVFPFIKTYFHKLNNSAAKEKKETIKNRADNPVAFNFNHAPYLYAGHSFPKDSAELMLSRDEHFGGLLKKMDPPAEEHFRVRDSIYLVQKGETLYAIARHFGLSVAFIKATNHIPLSGIEPGMLLRIIRATDPVGYYGIDVSSWQNSIDWKAVQSDTLPSPLKFYILKATQGKDIVDFYYAHNRENAKKGKAIIGAYHFYASAEDPVLQANNYISHVTLEKGDLRPLIDLEFECSNCNSLSIPKARFVSKLKIFLSYIEAHYHTRPVLYTYSYFYDQYLKGNFDQYTYWMASYTQNAPVPMNMYGAPDHGLKPEIGMWQFSSSEKIRGIAGNVDISFLPAEDLDSMLIK